MNSQNKNSLLLKDSRFAGIVGDEGVRVEDIHELVEGAVDEDEAHQGGEDLLCEAGEEPHHGYAWEY